MELYGMESMVKRQHLFSKKFKYFISFYQNFLDIRIAGDIFRARQKMAKYIYFGAEKM